MKLLKIVSGGQTGADRAAWDAAIEAGIEIGGFVPRGRLAEDGLIPSKYSGLIETGTADPDERTELNVINSDGTLVFAHGTPIGGTDLTLKHAVEYRKPSLQIDLSKNGLGEVAGIVKDWLLANNIKVLNVAGPRASEDGSIYEETRDLLRILFLKITREID